MLSKSSTYKFLYQFLLQHSSLYQYDNHLHNDKLNKHFCFLFYVTLNNHYHQNSKHAIVNRTAEVSQQLILSLERIDIASDVT